MSFFPSSTLPSSMFVQRGCKILSRGSSEVESMDCTKSVSDEATALHSDDSDEMSTTSDSSHDSDESEWDSDYEDVENWMAQMETERQNTIQRVLSSSTISNDVCMKQEAPLAVFSAALEARRRASDSAIYGSSMKPMEAKKNVPLVNSNSKDGSATNIKPDEYFMSILHDEQSEGARNNEFISRDDLYLEVTPENQYGYPEAAQAARSDDFDTLVRMHQSGMSLQCCNTFGESILHIVCRRNNLKILKFLMEEADVSIRVKDDMGRTPLHDAAWTDKPNFDLVKMLVMDSPDQLLAKDKRGHMPLSYVRYDEWSIWCTFLDENITWIRDALLNCQSKKNSGRQNL